jgi:predicted MFS family arabinose efflux permease
MIGSRGEQERLARNPAVIRMLAFFQVFMVIVPVAVPLFGDRGLDLTEILQLQALFGVTVMICEVPSGYVADLLGRRVALIVGAVFLGIGHTLLAFAHDFWTLAAFELALGVGVSLISGADVALLYDTQLALGDDAEERQRGLGGLFFVKSLSEAGAGLAAATVLFWATLEELVLVQLVVGWLPLAFSVLVVEPPIERMSAGSHLDNVGAVLRSVLANGAVLRLTFLLMGAWSLSTYYAVWLIQAHWEREGVSLVAFGVMWALLACVAGFASRQAAWFEARLGIARLLGVVVLLPVFGYAVLAAGQGGWALLVAPVFWFARGVGWVVLQEALNRRLASTHRATANSLVSFVMRGGFALSVPVTGAMLRASALTEVFLALAAGTLAVWIGLTLPLIRAVHDERASAAGTPGG